LDRASDICRNPKSPTAAHRRGFPPSAVAAFAHKRFGQRASSRLRFCASSSRFTRGSPES
jgi:hypothetical protein